jgi:hypothetical protein
MESVSKDVALQARGTHPECSAVNFSNADLRQGIRNDDALWNMNARQVFCDNSLERIRSCRLA